MCMNENKYIAILVKPVMLDIANEDINIEQKLADSISQISHRYQVDFEELPDSESYVMYMPLQSNCMDIVSCLRLLVKPYELLITIGVCKAKTNENKSQELAFHQAKVAMKKLEKQRKRHDYRHLNMKVQLPSEYETLLISMNMMILFDCDIQNGWTKKQRDTVFATYFEGMNQKEVAQYFHVSQPNIHQVLKKAKYSLYRDIMNTYYHIFENMNE